MRISPFDLERWLAESAADAAVSLAGRDVRPPPTEDFDLDPGRLGAAVPTGGSSAFSVDLGAYHGREASETIVTPGLREANLLAALAVVDEHAVVVTPASTSFLGLADALGDVAAVRLEGPGWTLDPAAIGAALEPWTDLVAVVNPNDPTGRSHDEATMRAVYERCADNGTYLLCDERFRPLDPDPIPPVAARGRYGISTGSVSTAFGLAGLRVGWLCGPPAVVSAAESWADYTSGPPSGIGLHVAEQAFDRRGSILPKTRAHVAENRTAVEALLDAHGLAWSDPDCGTRALCAVPEGFAGGRSFCRSVLTEASVALAPGEAVGCPDRFVIGLGAPASELEAGLSRLDTFLQRHR